MGKSFYEDCCKDSLDDLKVYKGDLLKEDVKGLDTPKVDPKEKGDLVV